MPRSVRLLFRYPASSLAVILTVALAGSAGVLACVLALWLLRPLPYPNAARLAAVYESGPDGRDSRGVSPPGFLQLRDSSLFESAGALAYGGGGTFRGEQPERVLGVYVSPAFFSTLGVQPALGRFFDTDSPRNSVILSLGPLAAPLRRRCLHPRKNAPARKFRRHRPGRSAA